MSEWSVSVLTPSYDQARFLARNLASVAAQAGPDDEHIVVDGGSTDGSVDLLRRQRGARWLSEPDRGQADAVNKAFALSRGRLIVWLNSDDVLAPGALAALREVFAAPPRPHLVCGDIVLIDAADRVIERRPADFDRARLLAPWRGSSSVFQPGTVFRREVFETCGPLDVALRYAMDYDFFLRATARYPIRRVPFEIGRFRVHGASKTGEGRRPFAREIRRCLVRRLAPEHPWGARWAAFQMDLHEARVMAQDAVDAWDAGRRDEARRLWARAFAWNPLAFYGAAHVSFRLRGLLGRRLHGRLVRRGRRVGGPPVGLDE